MLSEVFDVPGGSLFSMAKRRDGADRTYPRGEPKSLQVRLPGNGAGVSRAKSRNGRRGVYRTLQKSKRVEMFDI